MRLSILILRSGQPDGGKVQVRTWLRLQNPACRRGIVFPLEENNAPLWTVRGMPPLFIHATSGARCQVPGATRNPPRPSPQLGWVHHQSMVNPARLETSLIALVTSGARRAFDSGPILGDQTERQTHSGTDVPRG